MWRGVLNECVHNQTFYKTHFRAFFKKSPLPAQNQQKLTEKILTRRIFGAWKPFSPFICVFAHPKCRFPLKTIRATTFTKVHNEGHVESG